MEKKDIVSRVKVLASMPRRDEDEQKELESLNEQLAAIKANEEAARLLKETEEAERKEAEANQKKAIEDAIKAEREKWEAKERRLPYSEGAPHQTRYHDMRKYENLDAADLSVAFEVGKSLGVQFDVNAVKAMSLRVAELKDNNTEESRKGVEYVKNAFKAASDGRIEATKESVEAAIKAATDPMYTGGSGIGSDWVGTAYSQQIWNAIRAENRVASRIPSDVIPDGYSSKTWPLESTDMTWYKVAEATASDSTLKVPAATVAASQIATGSKNITVAKIGARGIYTGELTEDSLLQFSPQLRVQLEMSGQEIVESLFIDGDVETSANKNINDIAGTPAATDYFLAFDGFRKLALVTNTANSRSAAGALLIEDYIETLKLMGTAGLSGSDPSKVAFIVDGNVHYANMKILEVKTKDVNSAATVENGFLRRAYGVEIIPSWQMHRGSTVRKANTSGKIDLDTVGNNTTGSILAVRFDQWKQAYKRRMTIETTRIANADAYEIVALARLGLAYRDTEAAAISYNVGV